ncbi:hypothetical protein TPHA_0C02100 [Tetrapisispora phaffii CBS 4417]|uniref:Glucosidase 2 subunit beta n=1 Tax=Tetrapisispora phaffii (strain ATCC 24235 / CBS 4417 / NBRC 1672 / NRRL Y-8282 / UCD 70-5) TaxID=1071381 RepID=G8BRI9_TETPH|nr:hypothetical protein TPHA_0C02100 [Tetrapisispora phaffii CBS 4417]CCE62365.1 hypothetical protein TPHA_0C02100 [Tetrapisispora phaffii CBS 4417]
MFPISNSVNSLLLISVFINFTSGENVDLNKKNLNCESSNIVGVAPDRQSLYKPGEDGKFHCLNAPSIAIDFKQVNDGVCDCPDGSDEPGTGACGNEDLFYCENKGFIPRYISNSKVGDGICDCCDCSDELMRLRSSGVEFNEFENNCSILSEEFDKMVDSELNIYSLGYNSLNELKKKYNIESVEDKLKNSKIQSESIKDKMKDINKKYENYQSILNDERVRYENELKLVNPILLEFEKLDIKYLQDTLSEKFEDIKKINKVFRELTGIMENLIDTYTSSMNDKVVNDNVKKYNKLYSDKKLKRMFRDCNPVVDEDQKGQLLDYLSYELPTLFSMGLKFDDFEEDSSYYNQEAIDDKKFKTVKYNVGKINFVRSLLLGKFSYTGKTIEIIEEIMAILEDITNNFNVNFQDKGVLNAISAYKKVLDQYNGLSVTEDGSKKGISLPIEFSNGVEELFNFVTEKVPTFLEVEDVPVENNVLENNENDNIFGRLNKFLVNVKNDINNEYSVSLLKSLRSQINTHENELQKLNETLELNENSLKSLNEFVEKYQTGDENIKNTKELVIQEYKDLLNKMKSDNEEDGIFCINDAINNYLYNICFDSKNGGRILQKELKGDGNVILIGDLNSINFDDISDSESITNQKYIEYLKTKYSTIQKDDDDEDDNQLYLIDHLVNETSEIGKVDYLIDALYEINNGIKIEFNNGDKCWNGPKRSATVVIKCDENFKISNVQETTKCNYIIEIVGPLGCSSNYHRDK